MNAQAKQEAPSWPVPSTTPQLADETLIQRWRNAISTIRAIALEEGWTKSEVARRADMPLGSFSSWYDGTYKGRFDTQTARIENFIAQREEALKVGRKMLTAPGFIQTRVARELFTAFTYAQMVPTIAVVIVGSGLGKSIAARAFKNSRPHVIHHTLSPSSANIHTLKQEIGEALGIDCRDSRKIKQQIVEALTRADGFHSLLILDEAQNLDEAAINELRHFRDLAGCGLVLLGNEEGATPYARRDPKHSSAQVARRIGHRVTILKPYEDDIAAFIDAWGLQGDELRQMAAKIARQAGAFGTLHETILTAGMIAAGHDRDMTSSDLKAAWENRGAGGLK